MTTLILAAFSFVGYAVWTVVAASEPPGDADVAKREVQTLYDRAGLSVDVSSCKRADRNDYVDSSNDMFRCAIRAAGCERSYLFSVPKAFDVPYPGEASPYNFQSLPRPCVAASDPRSN